MKRARNKKTEYQGLKLGGEQGLERRRRGATHESVLPIGRRDEDTARSSRRKSRVGSPPSRLQSR